VFSAMPPLGCKTNCYLDALTTVPSSDGPIMVKDENGAFFVLGHTFAYPNGTTHTLQIQNSTFTGASSGARYVFHQWSCTCGVAPTPSTTLNTPVMYQNYTVSGVGPFLAEFYKEYQLTVSFSDPSGNALSPASSLTLTSGSSSLVLSSFSAQWVGASVWTVTDASWQGFPGIAVPSQTIDLTGGSKSASVQLNAFSATIRAVDASNNPVSGVVVTVTLHNSTVRTFTTNSQGMVSLGHIPTGPYTATATYNGAQVGSWSTDASQNPLLVIPVNPSSGGSTPTSTAVSSTVLLTILGLAVLLIVVAIKVRKPSPPPMIEP
jgi:hypothetical protein